jgi:hypothetical protein
VKEISGPCLFLQGALCLAPWLLNFLLGFAFLLRVGVSALLLGRQNKHGKKKPQTNSQFFFSDNAM